MKHLPATGRASCVVIGGLRTSAAFGTPAAAALVLPGFTCGDREGSLAAGSSTRRKTAAPAVRSRSKAALFISNALGGIPSSPNPLEYIQRY